MAYFAGSLVSESLSVGIVIAALAPAAMNSPFFVSLIDGDKELSVSTAIIANLSSIIYIPLMLFLFFGMKILIPYEQIITNVFILIFLPLFLAFLTRRLLKSSFSKFTKLSGKIIPFILFTVLWIIFSTSADKIWSSLSDLTVIIPLIFLISSSGFLLGYVLVKNKKIKRTLCISCGYKNQSLVIGIFYGINPLFVIPPTIYLIVHHLINGLIIWLFEKKKI